MSAKVGTPFCANVECVLHIFAGDPRIQGSGNWAQLPYGLIFSRRPVGALIYSDRCAKDKSGDRYAIIPGTSAVVARSSS